MDADSWDHDNRAWHGSLAHTRHQQGHRADRYVRPALAAVGVSSMPEQPDDKAAAKETTSEDCPDASAFQNFLISSSLNNFMTEDFACLLRIRAKENVSWEEAQRRRNSRLRCVGGSTAENQGHGGDLSNESGGRPQERDPGVLFADHISDREDRSILLIAMQFAIHYLVRSTEFCPVCHEKLTDGFKALRPYVCSSPLCLYQYINLGFGPDIEHEVLTQPFVVDLLISFCYSSIQYPPRIREYPNGLQLEVPSTAHLGGNWRPESTAQQDTPQVDVLVNFSQNIGVYDDPKGPGKISEGQWVLGCTYEKKIREKGRNGCPRLSYPEFYGLEREVVRLSSQEHNVDKARSSICLPRPH